MNILVTGSAGVIGSHAMEALLAFGDRPIAVDTAAKGALVEGWGETVTFHPLDVTNLLGLIEVCRLHSVSTVIHLAALVGSVSDDEPMRMFHTNMKGTMNVLEAARRLGIRRVLMASTLNVYPSFQGPPHGPPTHLPVPEDHPLDPRRPYDVWKYAAERIGTFYREHFGLEFAAFRFAIYYAPERVARRGTKVTDLLHLIIHNAIQGIPTRLPSGADRVLDCLYVRDLGRALVLAAHADALPHSVYNIGSGAPLLRDTLPQQSRQQFPRRKLTLVRAMTSHLGRTAC